MKKHEKMLKVMLERLIDLRGMLCNEDLTIGEQRDIQEAMDEVSDLLFDMGYSYEYSHGHHSIRDLITNEVVVTSEETT